MTTLAILNPIDPGTGNRVQLRVCSSQDPAATGADNAVWWPAIASAPVLSLSLFDGDFTAAVEPGAATMALRIDVLRSSGLFPRVERYDWAGSQVELFRLVDGALVDLATMRVERFAMEDFALALNLAVDPEPFEADVLFGEYAGTTGLEGGADLKGTPKPWVFGRAVNVEPVFIDEIDNVFQVHGYGAVSAISAIYERGATFGNSQGNFADYAALVAADLGPGQWGTCLAQGLFRLGAPPAGVITCDVDGDTTVGFLRRTGAIIKEVARRLGLSASVNAASFDALDTAVARNVNIVINQQTSLLDLARRMTAPCNSVCGIDLDGRLIVSRVAFGTEQYTLDAQGRQMPPVLGMARQNTSPPYRRIVMGAARSWRVHTLDEIAFYSTLTDRGGYDTGTVYREGDIVSSADGTRWLYINVTATSGNAPPTWPTTSNVYWENLNGPQAAGANGLNSATVTVYQRAASAPAVPSLTNAYTFSSGTLSALNNGWSLTAPADNGQPLWITTAFVSSDQPTVNILTGDWTTVRQLVVSGAAGAAGLNQATVYLYVRAASTPAVPSTNTEYTFVSGAVAGQNNGWTRTIPAGTNPLYVITAAAIGSAAIDTILPAEWSSPTILALDGEPGSNGVDGLNSARVLIYRRSATSPTLPSATTTYTFATGGLTGLNNSWTTTIPATDGNPLWVSAATATAAATAATDTILAGEWATPSIIVQDGAEGVGGLSGFLTNEAHVVSTNEAGTSYVLTTAGGSFRVFSGETDVTASATFSIVGGTDAGASWTQTKNGLQMAIGETSGTYSLSGASWTSASETFTLRATYNSVSIDRIYSISKSPTGATGDAGASSAVITLYRRSAESPAPAKPTSSSMVYTFATGVVTNTDFWSQTAPAANGFPLWVTQLAVSATSATVTVAGASFSTPVIISRDGVSATTGLLTNEAHTVAAAADGTGYSLATAGGNFEVFFGGANVRLTSTFSIVGGTDGGANWTKTQNGLTMTISEASGVYTLTGASWTTDTETFTLRSVYQGVTLDQTYTITKSRAGATGAAAKTITLSASRQQVRFNSAGTLDPTSQDTVFTVARQNTAVAAVWTIFDLAGGAASGTLLTGTGDTRTLTAADFNTARGSTQGVRVVATVTDGTTLTDQVTVIRVQDGVDANQVRIATNFETFPFIAHTGEPVTQTATLTAALTAISGTVTWRLKAQGSETLITPTASYGTVSGNTLTITQTQFAAFLVDYPGTTMRIVATLGAFSDERVLTRVADATTNPAGGSFIRTRNGDVSIGGWIGAATSTTIPAAVTRAGARSLQLATNSRERPAIRTVIRTGDSFRLRYRIRTIGSGTACGNIFFALYNDTGTPLTTSTSFANLPIHAPNTLDWTYVDQVVTYTASTEIIDWCPAWDSINSTVGNFLVIDFDMDFSPTNPVAAANSNRVPLSRMEGGQGWALLDNSASLPVTQSYGETSGYRYFRAAATATAGAQAISIGTGSGPAFRMTAGERVSVQARVEWSGAGATSGSWQLELWTFNSDGVTQFSSVVASGSGTAALNGTLPNVQVFFDVPAGRFFGRFELRAFSGAAGAIQLSISEPMVTTAAVGQTTHPAFVAGPNSENGADVTATAQRTIEPQFPVIEIKQGEAGHTGNRTVTHVAKRGTATITGGTWSLPIENLGAGDATINSSTGTVTLSGIVQSGAYSIRYTHTDGIATDLPVNVTYVPTPTGAATARTGRQTSIAGTANVSGWQTILSLGLSDCPAGRVRFGGFEGLSFLDLVSGTGTASFEARLRLDGATTLSSVASQTMVSGGIIQVIDVSALFNGSYTVASGSRTFTIELQRTSGTGTITQTNTALEATVIAT